MKKTGESTGRCSVVVVAAALVVAASCGKITPVNSDGGKDTASGGSGGSQAGGERVSCAAYGEMVHDAPGLVAGVR